jgi:mRNA interferase RelE/StbE
MTGFQIEWKKSAEKELYAIANQDQRRIIEAVSELSENPFSIGSHKLQGAESLYRIRVGDYRIIYDVNVRTKIITVQYVRHRKGAYREL